MTAVRRALYEAAATVAALTLLPALASPRWRSGLRERLALGGAYDRKGSEGAIWVHGASVGEVLAARGLVKGLLEGACGRSVFFTAFTPTGKATAEEAFSAFGDRVSCALLPLDWWGAPRRALSRKKPAIFILLETELWPGLLDGLESLGVPAVLVNGRISAASLRRYHAMRWFFTPFLKKIRLICVRTERDAVRFRSIGAPADKIRVTGNIKYERVSREGVSEKARRWKDSLAEAPLFVAGSLRRGEGRTVLEAYGLLKKDFPDLALAIAPRYPDRFDTKDLDATAPGWTAWSRLEAGVAGSAPRIVFVDTVGDLADIYGVASLAFVGGTLEDGRGHNMLEPAARGVPVLFGPTFRNFEDEAQALLSGGGGFVVASGREMARKAGELLAERGRLRAAGEKARGVASGFEGALGVTLAAIEEVVAEEAR